MNPPLGGGLFGRAAAKCRNLARRASPLAFRIVFTVGRAAPTGCLSRLSPLSVWSCSPAGPAEEAWNPQDDDKKTSFATPLAHLRRRDCFFFAGLARSRTSSKWPGKPRSGHAGNPRSGIKQPRGGAEPQPGPGCSVEGGPACQAWRGPRCGPGRQGAGARPGVLSPGAGQHL